MRLRCAVPPQTVRRHSKLSGRSRAQRRINCSRLAPHVACVHVHSWCEWAEGHCVLALVGGAWSVVCAVLWESTTNGGTQLSEQQGGAALPGRGAASPYVRVRCFGVTILVGHTRASRLVQDCPAVLAQPLALPRLRGVVQEQAPLAVAGVALPRDWCNHHPSRRLRGEAEEELALEEPASGTARSAPRGTGQSLGGGRAATRCSGGETRVG